MLSVLSRARKSLGRAAIAAAALALAACQPAAGPGASGPAIDSSAPVVVALLVPSGSGQASDELLARSLQNAARLAVSDLGTNRIDLRVYNTSGQPATAQAMTTQAIADGAKIILGPVFAQEANAAGAAARAQGVNVLAFSNNPDIAGGNVFILGPTFGNTAARLATYAVRNGKRRIMVVHDQNTAGQLGRAAIEQGVARAGGTVVGVDSYEFSQNGVVSAAPRIAATARDTSADAVFLTADTAGALPLISQLLADNGMGPAATQFIGLTRWDIPQATLALPGVQGGWFALPDPALYQQYQSRYQAAFGEAPHPISGLAYDGIAAIGALLKQGRATALTGQALTQSAGFVGVNGIFRLRSDGQNERGLAVAEIRNNQVMIIDPAPRSFGGAGF
ncbi:penicillin-binding protein activator [Pseudorhodobacter sp. MZDSW-24AT]|uniref:penicillin-binding protein activator n=1 Tax=Pseudorhodobacter sp. MZDSW-24AT TaxID=2052957 RepID=UPI000C1EF3B0|nr:penicillin-binding protein activator [Pseudorhodobacter sp. MZDSW-24AT]PJF07957.1 penicillin-binding protein activator [Pseudorhodobacter sp. MZDSW-24AT]